MAKMYEFSVNLDDRYVRVVAADKLSASKQGAQALGVVWRERARDLVIIQDREIRRKEMEKQSPSPSDLRSATSPRGRGKGADAPAIPQSADAAHLPLHKGGKGTSASGQNSRKAAAPTFKTGPLAGQQIKRKGK